MEGRLGAECGVARRSGGRLEFRPKVRPLWSAFGSRMEGVAYWLSRYLPALLAYLESLKPPLLENVLPEYRSWVVVP